MRAILIGLLLTAFGVPAGAQQMVCGDEPQVTRMLAEQYGERPRSQGATSTGTLLIRVYAAPDGSWTVVTIAPDGTTCLVAEGEGWAALPDVVPGRDG